jgi:drug/metabolite transporter (DMT)-like permease
VIASRRALLAALGTVFLWASAFPLASVTLASFDPAALAAFPISIAAVLMVGWWLWRRPQVPSVPDTIRLAACGAIGIASYNLFVNSGQQTVGAGATSFIVNTAPIITALLAAAVLGERLTAVAWVGTLISFAGVTLIASGQPGGLDLGAGSSLIVGAAVSQSFFFVLQRPLLARYGPATCAPAVVIFGAACLAPWLPGAIAQVAAATSASLVAAILLAVFPAALGYATWGIA